MHHPTLLVGNSKNNLCPISSNLMCNGDGHNYFKKARVLKARFPYADAHFSPIIGIRWNGWFERHQCHPCVTAQDSTFHEKSRNCLIIFKCLGLTFASLHAKIPLFLLNCSCHECRGCESWLIFRGTFDANKDWAPFSLATSVPLEYIFLLI